MRELIVPVAAPRWVTSDVSFAWATTRTVGDTAMQVSRQTWSRVIEPAFLAIYLASLSLGVRVFHVRNLASAIALALGCFGVLLILYRQLQPAGSGEAGFGPVHRIWGGAFVLLGGLAYVLGAPTIGLTSVTLGVVYVAFSLLPRHPRFAQR